MAKDIHAKVVAIIDDRELVINRGFADGVEVGMRFVILDDESPELTDPDTGESLGSVLVPKAAVKIVRLQGDHLAVGRTFRTVAATKGVLSVSMPDLFGTPGGTEQLRYDPRDRIHRSPIRRGDAATYSSTEEYFDPR